MSEKTDHPGISIEDHLAVCALHLIQEHYKSNGYAISADYHEDIVALGGDSPVPDADPVNCVCLERHKRTWIIHIRADGFFVVTDMLTGRSGETRDPRFVAVDKVIAEMMKEIEAKKRKK